jgi:hypothetical protein
MPPIMIGGCHGISLDVQVYPEHSSILKTVWQSCLDCTVYKFVCQIAFRKGVRFKILGSG